MFYVEKQVPTVSGLEVKYLNFHTLTQIRIDYINKEIEVNIASAETLADLQNGFRKSINAYMFNYLSIDRTKPIDLTALSLLTQIKGTVFENCEIKECEESEYNEEDLE